MKTMIGDGTAVVLCDGVFGTTEGKTAHGLVRHTERYRVLAVIDRSLAGRDAGEVLDGSPAGVPSSSSPASRPARLPSMTARTR